MKNLSLIRKLITDLADHLAFLGEKLSIGDLGLTRRFLLPEVIGSVEVET